MFYNFGGEVGLRTRTDFKAASTLSLARKMALAPGSYLQNAAARPRRARRGSSSPKTTRQRVARRACGTLDGLSPRHTLGTALRQKWLWISYLYQYGLHCQSGWFDQHLRQRVTRALLANPLAYGTALHDVGRADDGRLNRAISQP